MPLKAGWYVRTPEIRQKQSFANKRAWQDPLIRQRYLDAFSGRDPAIYKEVAKIMQKAVAKCWQNPEWVERWKEAQPKTRSHYYIKDREHYSNVQREKNKGRVITAEHRLHLCLARQRRPPMSDDQKQRESRAMKAKWQNPEYARWAAAQQNRRPNRLEKRLMGLLDEQFPNEWKYVGDGQIWIEGRNPDFININGKKLVIELLGNYWHTVKAKVTPMERVAHYKQYGFKCITIWQSQMKYPDMVTNTIRNMMKEEKCLH